jgi:hypothetical protein
VGAARVVRDERAILQRIFFAADSQPTEMERAWFWCGRYIEKSVAEWTFPLEGLTKYPSPVFSQVFILKGVKVLCFDTLLEVFILKVVRTSVR